MRPSPATAHRPGGLPIALWMGRTHNARNLSTALARVTESVWDILPIQGYGQATRTYLEATAIDSDRQG